MSQRRRLPNRRPSLVFDIELNGLRYTASVSRFPGGDVAEIFLQNHKPASQSDCNARDSAIAASLALQFGCPIETLRKALLRDAQGRPSTPLGAALDAIGNMEKPK
jgi:ribonucleoside-diphosphate reductase alpha chain